MMTTIPPEQIGRMLSGDEASQLILRIVDGRGRLRPGMTAAATTSVLGLRGCLLAPSFTVLLSDDL
jgi:hypothetical protein